MPPAESQQRTRHGRRNSGRQRPARRTTPVQPWDSSAFDAPRNRRYNPYALALTLAVHLAPVILLLLAAEVLTTAEKEEEKRTKKPTRVELVPPPFVQVNPFANQQRIRTDQEGAQNQRAAQEAEPDPSSHAEGPQLDGEDPRFNRVISGNPEAPDVAPAPPSPQGESDSHLPPAGGAAAPSTNAFELQTRAEYQQAQQQTAQTPAAQQPPAAATQQPTAQTSATQEQQPSSTAAQPPAAQVQQPAGLTAQTQQHFAQEQPTTQTAESRQQAAAEQQAERTTVAGRESPVPEPATATLAAKPDEQLAEEGLPPAEQTRPGDAAATAEEPAANTAAQQTQPEPAQPIIAPAQPVTEPTPEAEPPETVAAATPSPLQPQTAPEQPQPEPTPEPQQPASTVEQTPPQPTPEPTEPTPPQPEQAQAAAQTIAQGTEDTPAIDPNAPRPRPTLEPRISAGPLRHQSVAANARGVVAIDSRFSEFGAYQQRMIEAISAQWYMLARQSKAIDSEYGTQVVLVFTMSDQGTISNTNVRFTNASAAATLLCINAVESRSPFGAWTADMKRVLGDRQTVTFTFYYR